MNSVTFLVKQYYNVENEVNIKHWKNMKNVPATEESRRTGAIGFKVGMTSLWDRWGKRIALTVVQVTIISNHKHDSLIAAKLSRQRPPRKKDFMLYN